MADPPENEGAQPMEMGPDASARLDNNAQCKLITLCALADGRNTLNVFTFPANMLHCLRDALKSVAAKWYQIGLKLHMETADLHSIEKDLQVSAASDRVEYLEEMLKRRLEGEGVEPPTWKEIVLALRGVDESSLADQVAKEHSKFDHTHRYSRYCKGGNDCRC